MTIERDEHQNTNRRCYYDNKTNSDWYVESYDNSCKDSIKIVKPEMEKKHKKEEVPCCCKESLRKALQILSNPLFDSLIDPATFSLVGDNFDTALGNLSGISSCGDGSLTHTNAETSNVTKTTFCDIILIGFTLTTDEGTLADFIKLLLKSVPKLDPKGLCCKENEGCCCNVTKASLLANTMSLVTVGFNTSALVPNTREGIRVLAVTKGIAWLYNTTLNRVYVACLNGIYSIV